MAKFNEILVGRFASGLQRLFGLKGATGVSQLASEVQPVHALYSGVENRYLEGWNRFGQLQNVAAVALNTSVFRMRNPAKSNVVVVVEKLTMQPFSGTSATLSRGTAVADLATIGQVNTRLDNRGNPNPNLITSFQNTTVGAPALTAPVPLAETLNNSVAGEGGSLLDYILTENQELTILPGDALQVAADGVNTALNVAIIWRERILEESELSRGN